MTNDEIHAIKQSLCEQAGIELLFITEHDWLHCTKKMKHKIADILDEHIKLIHNAK